DGREWRNVHVIGQLGIADDRTGADPAPFADFAPAQDTREWLDYRVHADPYILIHRDGLRPLHCHPTEHQLAHLTLAERAIHRRQFDPVVNPEELARIRCLVSVYGVPGTDQNFDNVGQIVFPGGIIGLNLVHVLPEEISAEAINADVNLA